MMRAKSNTLYFILSVISLGLHAAGLRWALDDYYRRWISVMTILLGDGDAVSPVPRCLL